MSEEYKESREAELILYHLLRLDENGIRKVIEEVFKKDMIHIEEVFVRNLGMLIGLFEQMKEMLPEAYEVLYINAIENLRTDEKLKKWMEENDGRL